jgi:hypothetical protein
MFSAMVMLLDNCKIHNAPRIRDAYLANCTFWEKWILQIYLLYPFQVPRLSVSEGNSKGGAKIVLETLKCYNAVDQSYSH